MSAAARLRAEHRIVFDALDMICAVTDEAATADDVLSVLTESAVSRLDEAYVREPLASVRRILTFLNRKGHVRTENPSEKLYRPAEKDPEHRPSNRKIVLRLIDDCFEELGRRGLRSGDLRDFAPSAPYADHLSWKQIAIALASLIKTKDVQDLGIQPGGGRKGSRIFAPLGATVQQPPAATWLSHVYAMFEQVWNERLREAHAADRRPRPPSTGDIREAVERSGRYHDRLENPQLLVNAVRQLSERGEPKLRKVRRPGHRNLLWAPIGMSDEDLDLGAAFAADTERVVEAVRRAESSFNRPVELDEIQDQIAADPTLRPAGKSPVRKILADLAKTRLDDGQGGRARRAHQRIWGLGSVKGRSYFTSKDPEVGRRFVRALELKAAWEDLEPFTEINSISGCQFAPIRIGRALELKATASRLRNRVDELAGEFSGANEAGAGVVEDLLEESATLLLDDLGPLLADPPRGLPRAVDLGIAGFTPEELCERVEPFYPVLEKLDEDSEIVPYLDRAIRRVPNPDHTERFDDDPSCAAEYLFEKTDALTYIARRWGGMEAQYQANIVRNVLGRLRDPRFVAPLLETEHPDDRFVGVACLAFLQAETCVEALERLSREDPEAGIRASAAWALGFLDPTKQPELLEMLDMTSAEEGERRWLQL